MRPLHVVGMHGLGDNLHQRSLMRELTKTRDVWLETPWPCVYHDMPELHLIGKSSRLRTQAKNASREAARYSQEQPPRDAEMLEVMYSPTLVRECGSVLGAMSRKCGVPVGDFRMRVPEPWLARANELVASWKPKKPILIYRPLVERTEWTGCANRNPDLASYTQLVRSISEQFFVVSVADLVPDVEWTTSEDIAADREFHRGELDIEILAALVSMSGLVVSSPGFAIVLAQAVGTPSIVVIGGYEDATSFSQGAKLTLTLAIQPVRPCPCWSHHHQCDKRIDMPSAFKRLQEFVNATATDQPIAA